MNANGFALLLIIGIVLFATGIGGYFAFILMGVGLIGVIASAVRK